MTIEATGRRSTRGQPDRLPRRGGRRRRRSRAPAAAERARRLQLQARAPASDVLADGPRRPGPRNIWKRRQSPSRRCVRRRAARLRERRLDCSRRGRRRRAAPRALELVALGGGPCCARTRHRAAASPADCIAACCRRAPPHGLGSAARAAPRTRSRRRTDQLETEVRRAWTPRAGSSHGTARRDGDQVHRRRRARRAPLVVRTARARHRRDARLAPRSSDARCATRSSCADPTARRARTARPAAPRNSLSDELALVERVVLAGGSEYMPPIGRGHDQEPVGREHAVDAVEQRSCSRRCSMTSNATTTSNASSASSLEVERRSRRGTRGCGAP